MIDYVATTYQCKDTPNFDVCKHISSNYGSSYEHYALEGCKKMKVHWNPQMKLLKIEGSYPYFYKGHNITFSKSEFIESVDFIGQALELGNELWDADVDVLENGIIIPVNVKPKQIILSHFANKGSGLLRGEQPKDRGKFRWYEDRNEKIKMYDAVANMRGKVHQPRRVLEELGFGYNANLLKFENHINQPKLLNRGRAFKLEYLRNPIWLEKLNNHLIGAYKRLDTITTIDSMNNKKDFSADIILCAYLDNMKEQGQSLEDAKKQIYHRINMNTALEKTDKDARKRQVRKWFEKVEKTSSQWDLSDKIEGIVTKENEMNYQQK